VRVEGAVVLEWCAACFDVHGLSTNATSRRNIRTRAHTAHDPAGAGPPLGHAQAVPRL